MRTMRQGTHGGESTLLRRHGRSIETHSMQLLVLAFMCVISMPAITAMLYGLRCEARFPWL
jgi:hypothetical protein